MHRSRGLHTLFNHGIVMDLLQAYKCSIDLLLVARAFDILVGVRIVSHLNKSTAEVHMNSK